MAARRTRKTADAEKVVRIDVATLDGYIKYLEALAKVVCKADISWSVETGIRVTKICPPPQKAGSRHIIVTKAACPPPQGGWSDLCMALQSLLGYLKELRAQRAS
jgi:hypothetical protein